MARKSKQPPAPPTPPKPRPKRQMRVTRVKAGKRGKASKQRSSEQRLTTKKGKASEKDKGKRGKKAQAKKHQASSARSAGKAGKADAKRRSGTTRSVGRPAPSTGKRSKPATRPKRGANTKTVDKKRIPARPAKAKGKPGKKPGKEVKPRRRQRLIKDVPGFADVVKEAAAQVTKEFKEFLDKGKAALGGFVYVFHLRNNTVDAEWRLPVPRGEDPIDLALQMEESLRGVMLRRGAWTSSGIRFPPSRITPTHYDKWRSLLTVQAYAQRGNKRASNFATLRGIVENMAEKKRRKAEWIFVKLHWNVDDIKPTRDEI